MTNAERYESAKQISHVLCQSYGLCLSERYIRAIRTESTARGERLFVAGMAKPSEVLEWLKSNPSFRKDKAGKTLSAGLL
jgi:hypothetical protein